MLSVNVILFSATFIFIFGIKFCNATVSCATCQSISFNLTTDTDLNTDGCTLEEKEVCSLILRVDYTNSNNSFALIDGSQEEVLILTNGDPQVSEETFIWFNQLRVQRMANILCFAGTSCGLDLIKQIYRDQFRSFDYRTIQNKLVNLLYSSTPSSDLTCADSTGSAIPCKDGFCRLISAGNKAMQYSTCVKKGALPNPYGITVIKSTLTDIFGEQISIIFTCNKPMCNSAENAEEVYQLLASANIIPGATTTTQTASTTTQTASTTTQTAPTTTQTAPTTTQTAPTTSTVATTTRNASIKILNNKQILLISFLFLYAMFKF
ncbi:unnamed protein product [Rotaria sp. Silwood2]|nr:unnamed protein product [Rotaria sp. Silwood2]CAF2754053.1 unnamed protein product [Rotaria sp. Silwood2]CAF4324532.1 unnamed protein product [Rotaria sp. Silwood2]CAF4455817.1 unnamed protein product [Rotaria sp. Silwood2]